MGRTKHKIHFLSRKRSPVSSTPIGRTKQKILFLSRKRSSVSSTPMLEKEKAKPTCLPVLFSRLPLSKHIAKLAGSNHVLQNKRYGKCTWYAGVETWTGSSSMDDRSKQEQMLYSFDG